MYGVPTASDHPIPGTIQYITRGEGKAAQLLTASPFLSVPAVLSHSNNRLLFHGQHILSQR